MSTQYPNHLDNFINPTATDNLNSAVVPHADQHVNLNDAMEAVQTVLGVNPSGSFLTVKDRIQAAETQIEVQSSLNGLTDVTITSVAPGNVLIYNGSQWINDPKSNLVDGGSF